MSQDSQPGSVNALSKVEPASAEFPEDNALSADSSVRRTMNATAYRIFKLLQWLIEAPLNVDALNEKFCNDPLIGKPLSVDSIWLYINTLKALGCRIRRPSPRNGFQYEMLSHPFGLTLSPIQLETLSQVKAFAQQHFSHQEMLVLDGLLKKIVLHSDCDDVQATMEDLFVQSRSFDYCGMAHHIEALEQWINRHQLLQITYLSPSKGRSRICHFLPVAVYYDQGAVYVRGERAELEGASSLRVDRIVEMFPVLDDALLTRLKARRSIRMTVTLHILCDSPNEFTGFDMGENQGVYEEQHQWVDHAEQPYLEVNLQVRDWFFLKQRLLACGLAFRVLTPTAFKEDMRQTLETLLGFYQPRKGGRHA